MTAAGDLRKLGYPVTVFEALPLAGGMLRVGIPDYRLPPMIVDREVREIIDLGIYLRLNTPVTNLDEVMKEGFKAVLIAVGAHEGRKLPIPGADLPEVLVNTQVLRDVSLSNIGIEPEKGKTHPKDDHRKTPRSRPGRGKRGHGLRPHGRAPGRGQGGDGLPGEPGEDAGRRRGNRRGGGRGNPHLQQPIFPADPGKGRPCRRRGSRERDLHGI